MTILAPSDPTDLVMIRSLYTDAERMAAVEEDALQRFKALLTLDLAVERMLNVALTDSLAHLGASEPNNARRDWGKLWDHAEKFCNSACGVGFPYHSQLQAIHKARNRAQHHGETPDPSTVRKALRFTRSFLSSAFEALYDCDFGTFSQVELLQNDDLRQLLGECRECLAQGDYKWTAIGSIVAHQNLIEALQHVIHASTTHESTNLRPRFAGVQRILEGQLEKAFGEVNDRLKVLREEMAAVNLGMPMPETRKFYRFSSTVTVWGANRRRAGTDWSVRVLPVFHEDERPPFESDRAEFMFSYVSELAYRLQSSFPAAAANFSIQSTLLEQRQKLEDENDLDEQ